MKTRTGFRHWRIRNKLLAIYAGLFIPLLIISGLVTMSMVRETVQAGIDSELKSATAMITSMVRTAAAVSIKNYLRGVAEKNLDIVAAIYRDFETGKASREDILRRIRQILLSQKIGNTGYIYCINGKGVATLHPLPLVEGSDYSNYGFIQEQIRKKEGYIEYDWQNPGEPAARPKALYMTYFAPLDLIISVSSYREEFKSLVKVADFSPGIKALRFGATGYAYLVDTAGNTLIHPTMEGVNILTDGRYESSFLREMLTRKHGRIRYQWQNPGEPKPRAKLAIFDYLPEYGWIIGSSSYIEEIAQPLENIRNIMLIFLLVTIAIYVFLTFRFSAHLVAPIQALSERFKQATQSNFSVRIPDAAHDELGELGRYFNEFMERLERYRIRLQNEVNERRQAEQRLRTVVENAPAVIWAIDREGTFTLSEGHGLEVLGLRPGELVGQSLFQLFADHPDLVAHARRVLQGARFSSLTFMGEAVFDNRYVPLFNDAGEITGALGVALDVSEQHAARESLRESLERLSFHLVNSPLGVLEWDSAMELQTWSDGAQRIYGWQPAEVIGRNFYHWPLVFEDDLGWVARQIDRLLEGAAQQSIITCRTHAKNGDIRHCEWYNSVLRDRQGQLVSIFTLVQDITDRVRQEEENARLQAELLHSQKMEAVGRLAGGVAHDFNNLMQAVLGYAQLMLLDKAPQDSDYAHLQEVVKAAERARELTIQLLTFSRKIESRLESHDLNRLIRITERLLRRTLPRMIAIELVLAEDLPAIRADGVQIEQILLNLAVNASDAMGETGTIRIATHFQQAPPLLEGQRLELAPGDYVVLTVSDTGVGMTPELQARIFEPFFTTKPIGRGTGLGLSIVYGIVQNHHGHIACRSAPGQGSTFTLHFPAAAQPSETEAGVGHIQEAPIPGGTELILLVEDEKAIRDLGTEVLQTYGYRVIPVESGEAALVAFQAQGEEIDLVLLDLNMPGMGGQACLKALRDQAPALKVIIASGYLMTHAERDSAVPGVSAFIAKPYRLAEMLRTLREVLDQP